MTNIIPFPTGPDWIDERELFAEFLALNSIGNHLAAARAFSPMSDAIMSAILDMKDDPTRWPDDALSMLIEEIEASAEIVRSVRRNFNAFGADRSVDSHPDDPDATIYSDPNRRAGQVA